MPSRRAAFLDRTNTGLLAAIVALPLLALIVSAGPIRRFAQRASETHEQQRAEIARLAERKRELVPLAKSDRERVEAALADLAANVAALGENSDAKLAQRLTALLESSGARDVLVAHTQPGPDEEPPTPLVVAALDGSHALSLAPKSLQVTLRSDFAGLREALDALDRPGQTISVDSASFVREGDEIRADLRVTYWRREAAP